MENVFTLESDSFALNVNSTSVNASCLKVSENSRDNVGLDIPYVVMEILVAMFATSGNLLVITVFLRERRLRKRTNHYIVSLALADFLVGILGIPCAIMISVGVPENCLACLLMMSMLLSFCTVSIFSLVLISIDRFISVLYPMQYSQIQSWAMIEIIICWLLGCAIGFLPFIWHQRLPITRCFYHDVVTEGYQMFRFIVVILLPACIIFLIYGMIYKVVLYQLKQENIQQRSSSSCNNGSMKPHVDKLLRREIKVSLNIFTIVLIFMISWLPLNVIKSIKIFYTDLNVPDSVIAFGIILTHFNSAINPLMYAYHLKDFRHAILRLICCRRRETSVG